nr:hypothetical protein CFP56_23820 [Quercus suber]
MLFIQDKSRKSPPRQGDGNEHKLDMLASEGKVSRAISSSVSLIMEDSRCSRRAWWNCQHRIETLFHLIIPTPKPPHLQSRLRYNRPPTTLDLQSPYIRNHGLRIAPVHLLQHDQRRLAQIPPEHLSCQRPASDHLRPDQQSDARDRGRGWRGAHVAGGARGRAAGQHAALRPAELPADAGQRPARGAVRDAQLAAGDVLERDADAVCRGEGADAQPGGGRAAGGGWGWGGAGRVGGRIEGGGVER